MCRGGSPGEFGYDDCWFGFGSRGCGTPSLVLCLELLTDVLRKRFINGHVDLGK
jgi:hypothetical protein